MCDSGQEHSGSGTKAIPVQESVGTILAHDITEIRPGDFKGRAFRKGHLIREEDVCHLQRLGKEHLYVLHVGEDEMHENDAAYALANALMGRGAEIKDEPKEGKLSIVAAYDGLLTIDVRALHAFNMLGEVMCATLHTNTVVKKDQVIAATRAIPLVVKKSVVQKAVEIAECGLRNADFESEIENTRGVISVRAMRKPKTGVVITGNEVYHGRIKDAFAPVITKKIEEVGGEIVGIYYAPDDKIFIEDRLRELINAGADLLITTGGMSVDPDDVTRFAIKNLGAADSTYGSAVLPGAMVLIGYMNTVQSTEYEVQSEENSKLETRNSKPIPILGIPACGMYHKITVLDLVLPRILAGERIGRRELAALGHGGLCLNCRECRYPVCPFGKSC